MSDDADQVLSAGEESSKTPVNKGEIAAFFSMISHKLRTPLTSTAGALRLIRSDSVPLDSAQAKELIAVADNSAQQMIRLIDTFLDSKFKQPDELTECYAIPTESDFQTSTAGQTDHRLRILIVEDDNDYFRLVRQLLMRSTQPQFEVAHCTTLAECLQHISLESQPVFRSANARGNLRIPVG